MGRKSSDKHRKGDEEKKRQWAKQAFGLFQLGGLRDLSIDQIAKWLGKSKSTIYEYFESKEAIILYALTDRMAHLSGYQAILRDEGKSYLARYRAFLDLMVPLTADISNQFVMDLKRDFPMLWAMIEDFLQEMLAQLHAYHEGGVAGGEFKALSIPLMVKMDSLFIWNILLEPSFWASHQLTLQQIIEQYVWMKFEGIRK